MALNRKDLAATALTALAVLAFFATRQGWNVPLIGDSHRWTAGAVLLLGSLTCTLGRPSRDTASRLLGVLGALALGLAILALVSGSLAALALLVADVVALWLASTVRHLAHAPHVPVAH